MPRIISYKPVEDTAPFEGVFYKQFSGTLKRRPENNFGFVEDVFIPASLLGDAQGGAELSGTAAVSYNRVKDLLSWRATSLK